VNRAGCWVPKYSGFCPFSIGQSRWSRTLVELEISKRLLAEKQSGKTLAIDFLLVLCELVNWLLVKQFRLSLNSTL